MIDFNGVLNAPPSEGTLTIEVTAPEGDPIEWVRVHAVGGGWVQLTDRILARRGDDVGWRDAQGRDAELSGFVESAEGIDGDGCSWRLRWVGEEIRVWRILAHGDEAALVFDRVYVSTWSGAERLSVREYWTRQVQPGLEAPGSTGTAWAPRVACFSGWRDQS